MDKVQWLTFLTHPVLRAVIKVGVDKQATQAVNFKAMVGFKSCQLKTSTAKMLRRMEKYVVCFIVPIC